MFVIALAMGPMCGVFFRHFVDPGERYLSASQRFGLGTIIGWLVGAVVLWAAAQAERRSSRGRAAERRARKAQLAARATSLTREATAHQQRAASALREAERCLETAERQHSDRVFTPFWESCEHAVHALAEHNRAIGDVQRSLAGLRELGPTLVTEVPECLEEVTDYPPRSSRHRIDLSHRVTF